MMKLIRLRGCQGKAVLLALLILGGCAAQNANLTPQQTDQLFKTFEQGDAQLTCGVPCSGRYGYNRRGLRKLHDRAEWTALATRVLTIGAARVQAYYYLGRAAEGINKHRAAEIYYRLAKGLLAREISFASNGFSFPKDIDARLQILSDIRSADSGGIDTNKVTGTPTPDTKDSDPVDTAASGLDSPSALRDADDLFAMIKKRPANERPMYGLIHERTPKNQAERNLIELMKKADKRFLASVSEQGLTPEKAAKLWAGKAWGYLDKKNPKAATKRLNQAWLLDSENGDIYQGFALVTMLRNGDPVQIEGYFLMALSKATFSTGAHLNYAAFLVESKRLDEAEVQIGITLKKEPTGYKAHTYMAIINFVRKEYAEACKWGRLARKYGEDKKTEFIDESCKQSEKQV